MVRRTAITKPSRLAKIPEGCEEVFEVYQSHYREHKGSYSLHGYFRGTSEVLDKYVHALNLMHGYTTKHITRFRVRHRACILLEGKYYVVNLNPITVKSEIPNLIIPNEDLS